MIKLRFREIWRLALGQTASKGQLVSDATFSLQSLDQEQGARTMSWAQNWTSYQWAGCPWGTAQFSELLQTSPSNQGPPIAVRVFAWPSVMDSPGLQSFHTEAGPKSRRSTNQNPSYYRVQGWRTTPGEHPKSGTNLGRAPKVGDDWADVSMPISNKMGP